ncbi:aminotransferase class III-fold pyridoxal phosphate-dependent enzyme [Streptomyces peucetius]|uniref:Aminotransferase class III-fold pyridoxal phosphate-dependent enzyme n=1 Tax=Streptomyces peucetius TaxID=1950 RepID=A0ABY6HZM8_STRPE|nr:aminotransferase class III-fold pyridoxal phosphate-dependent enzyme [Streptomyces peucetius]UYQ60068.1 aminotransferase class III-fold pyridoxal phosphate-dependent enzyme [Streptomyces peucetius]
MALNVEYVRAEKDTMWIRTPSGAARPVLDLAGGYGASLFGHNHPALVSEARRLLSAHVPAHAQASIRRSAGELAAVLGERVGGDFVCLFSNTGAEVIESALKHAYIETGGSVFRAVPRSFHGKTTGAVALGSHGSEHYAPLGPRVVFSDGVNGSADTAAVVGASDRMGAVFFEAVQGEGGVIPLSEAEAHALAQEASRHCVPLIADEIQTGMGRTGTFLASEQLRVRPDYVCLSKALGGGLAKIGALLVARDRYQPEFSITHTSTFAEDEWSCAIALRAIRLMDEEGVPARCADTGRTLFHRLEQVRDRYPAVIREVRGRGLMVGVELADQSDSPSPILRTLDRNDLFGWFAAAYFLNVHDIRLLPTLSAPRTLRIEPSAFVTTAEIEQFVVALATFCEALHRLDLRHLISFVAELDMPPSAQTPRTASIHRQQPQTEIARVAFIGHLLAATDARLVEPELAELPNDEVERFLEVGAELVGPMILDQRIVESARSATHLTFIGLPVTASYIAARRADERAMEGLRNLIGRASKIAEELGCSVLGLGGYTSAIMDNGLRLRGSTLAVTSGNNLTAAMSIAALETCVADEGLDLSGLRVAVCGALGSIGKVCALLLASKVKALTLIVRDAGSPRVKGIIKEIGNLAGDLPVTVSSDLHDLCRCDVVVGAMAAGGALIDPQHLGPEARVVCDIAKPSDFSPLVARERPCIRFVEGGIVRLPQEQSFAISGIPLPPGNVYACMAETLLLGMEPSLREIGIRLNADTVRMVASAASEHGFAPA